MFNELLNTVENAAKSLDPVYNKIDKKTKKMVKILIDAGFEPKDVKKFADTYTDDLLTYAKKRETDTLKDLKKQLAEQQAA